MLLARSPVRALALAAAGLCLSNCSTPAAVEKFAGAAQRALAQGPAIFKDIADSCVRRHVTERDISPEFQERTAAETGEKDCQEFAVQRDALIEASKVLEGYFKTIQSLASFGAPATGKLGGKDAAQIGSAAKLTKDQSAALGKLGEILTQAITEGYQRRRLAQHLRDADPAIQVVTSALQRIVAEDYKNELLAKEQQALRRRYGDLAQAGAKNTAIVGLLDWDWERDMKDLNQRRAAAAAYVAALGQVREGHHKLVENADHLSAKEMFSTLDPYTSSLEGQAVPVTEPRP